MIRDLFSEKGGQLSSTRIMSFVALFVAVVYTFTSSLGSSGKTEWDILLLWVTAAFVPKVIQKFAEVKNFKEV